MLFCRYLGGGILDGGGDTTAGALRSVVLMLVAFPHVQEKLAQEMNAIVGDRLPTLEDADHLPYLRAFINEVCTLNVRGLSHTYSAPDVSF
jgi:cytochrome P450